MRTIPIVIKDIDVNLTVAEIELLEGDNSTKLLQQVVLIAMMNGAVLVLDEEIGEIDFDCCANTIIRTNDKDVWTLYDFLQRGILGLQDVTLRVTEMGEILLGCKV